LLRIKYIFLTDFDATFIEKNSPDCFDEFCSDKNFLNKIEFNSVQVEKSDDKILQEYYG
jgi:hypothetical protein